jgi:hypothetical protein
MATKKQQEVFNNKVSSEIKKLGGTRVAYNNPTYFREYILKTEVGELEVTLHDPTPSPVFSIFARFKDIDNARVGVPDKHRLNHYSGKYNFHSVSADECLEDFLNDIKQIV